MLFVVFGVFVYAASASENAADNNSQLAIDPWANVFPPDYSKYWPHTLPEYMSKRKAGIKVGIKDYKCPVQVTILPRGVTEISLQNQDYQMAMNLQFVWQEPRLNEPTGLPISMAILPPHIAANVWAPTIEFLNCEMCEKPLIDPEYHRFSFNKKKGGPIVFTVSYRKIFRFTCNFDLSNFPMDIQNCSYIFAITDIYKFFISMDAMSSVNFHEFSSQIGSPPEFHLIDFRKENCTETDMTNKGASSVDCFKFTLFFQRETIPHLMLTYIPSLLIVILSWISFWLKPEESAPRTALGLTSLLTLATQFSNVQNKLPEVSCLKAIDVWMFACIFMVFASLFEFAIVNFWRSTHKSSNRKIVPSHRPAKRILSRSIRKLMVTKHVKATILPRGSPKWAVAPTAKVPCWRRCRWVSFWCKATINLDTVCRFVFPSMFFLFNIIYWNYYGETLRI